jgi:hypothetical protein
MVTGRPRKFTNADDMYKVGMDYINKMSDEGKHLTVTGVAIALDTTRDVLNEYSKGTYDTDLQDFSTPVKRLKALCEHYAEERLFANNPTGAIFALKNYGWKDKTEVTTTGVQTVKVIDLSSFSVEELKEMSKDDK